jgi:hypothetical protein
MKLFNNLKFGAKLWFFASVMIIAIIIVATTSILASKGSIRSGDEYAVISDYSKEFLNRETDHTKCKLGQHIHGPEGQKLLHDYPDMREHMDDLIEAHEHLHSSAKGIQSHWVQTHPGLKDNLSTRLDEHRNWALVLACDIIDNRPISVETNPEKCAFGKWLRSSETQKMAEKWPEFSSLLKEVSVHHQKLHDSAQLITNETTSEKKFDTKKLLKH